MKNLWPLLLALLIISSCKNNEHEVPVQSVTLDKGEAANVYLGSTLPLSAVVLPKEATSKATWVSSDPSIATVSPGLVTPLKEGEVTITVTEGGVTAKCKIRVLPALVEVADISFASAEVFIAIKQTTTLKPVIAPENATDKTLEWTSDKEGIATVSEAGVVTALAEGTCMITVKSVSNPAKMAICAVIVSAHEIPVTGISLTPARAYIVVNETRELTVVIAPESATNKKLTWSTSDAFIAEVSDAGLVTAKSAGTATITANVSNSDKAATCVVTVTNEAVPVTGLTASPADTIITAGTTFELRHHIMPADATNVNVTYESSEATKALVSVNGIVTAIAEGKAIIVVKSAADQTIKATCVLKVIPALVLVQSITLSPSAASLSIGQKQQLSRTILPADADNPKVHWSSADDSKATVSVSGEVTAVASGQVVISAIANDGSGIVGRTTVTVFPRATGITFTPANPVVLERETLTLSAAVLPAGAIQTVTWSSGDPAKATINAITGAVLGVGGGTVTITATTTDGSNTTGTVTLTVQALPVSNASITAITLGDENLVTSVPNPGSTTRLNHAPRTIASNLSAVKVTITATAGALIKIGTTDFISGNTVNCTNSVTFTVTEAGKSGSKEYTLTITPYNKSTNPYGIYTLAHLHDLRNALSEGFKLMNDLTMPAASAGFSGISDYGTKGWLPVGGDTAFTGILDGAGHQIDNFFTKRTAQYVGLFGKAGGTIKNLGVNGRPQVSDRDDGAAMGDFAGESSRANQYTGILVGYSEGAIEDCYTSGVVYIGSTASLWGSLCAGGLVGFAKGTISRCHATGKVLVLSQGTPEAIAGGLIGLSDQAVISECYATGNIYAMSSRGQTSSLSGGLIGECLAGSVSKCYATGTASARSGNTFSNGGTYAGGLIGHSYSRINNCYATGKAFATTTNSANVTMCLAAGFIGHANGFVSNCYAVGDAEASVANYRYKHAAGFVAHCLIDLTNCYRNSSASTKKDGMEVDASDRNVTGLTAKTRAEMRTVAFRNNLNQGQSAVWGQGGKNGDLPYLIGVGVGK